MTMISEYQARGVPGPEVPGWGSTLSDLDRHVTYKAMTDFVLALILLLGTLPLMVLAMVLVRLTSRGPVLYSQTRVGRHGRTFSIYKIRTMYHDCERLTGPVWSIANDPRVTPVGRFLRDTHLDELPQLWNVLRGEMSLVGPRPERPEFVAELEKAIPCYRDRLQVRPGVTGLAQIQLAPDTDLNSVRRKLACDLYYIQHLSPWLDYRIIMSTCCSMVGVSFVVTRAILRIPSGGAIEEAYRDRLVQALSVAQVQSA